MPAATSRHWLLLTLAASFLAAQLIPVLQAFPNGLIDDDGYFYAQVAYNLGRHAFSSFDGIHQTSGYHLVWGAALGAISAIVGLITSAKSVHLAAFFFCGIWISGLVALRAFRDPLTRAAAFCLLLFGFSLAETVLLTAVVIVIVDRMLAAAPPLGTRTSDLALVALVPLIRIDAFPLAIVLLAGIASRGWRAYGRLALSAIGGALLHFAWMYAMFGEFFSVSSMVKVGQIGSGLQDVTHFVLGNMLNNITASRSQSVRFAAVWVLTALALWRVQSTVDRESRKRQLWAIAGVMTFYLPHFLLSRMRSWYFTPVHVVLLYLSAREALERRDSMRRRAVVRTTCVALIVIYVAGIAYVNTKFGADQIHVSAFVQRLSAEVPEAARIFVVDGSGYLGFFSARPIINGDGLMNDSTYAARLRSRRLAGYLEEERICYVITNRENTGSAIVDVGGLIVRRADVSLVFKADTSGSSAFDHIELFRLRRPGCGS